MLVLGKAHVEQFKTSHASVNLKVMKKMIQLPLITPLFFLINILGCTTTVSMKKERERNAMGKELWITVARKHQGV